MVGTGVQDRDVASLQREYPALVAAEAYPALPRAMPSTS